MIAPALVDGRPLSHPDHDELWRAFVAHGVTPLFHVADQRRPFDDAWYTDARRVSLPPLESVFLWTSAALACTDMILNGALDRHPDLRIGIVELSAIWVPMFLMMLDGGSAVHRQAERPSRRRAVDETQRVLPAPGARVVVLVRAAGQADPSDGRPLHVLLRLPALGGHRDTDRRTTRGSALPVGPDDAPGLFRDNVSLLLA